MKHFGRRVKELRLRQKLTQEGMQSFGFNYRYFQKIEAGQVNVTLDTLLRLAKSFKCPISDLFKF